MAEKKSGAVDESKYVLAADYAHLCRVEAEHSDLKDKTTAASDLIERASRLNTAQPLLCVRTHIPDKVLFFFITTRTHVCKGTRLQNSDSLFSLSEFVASSVPCFRSAASTCCPPPKIT